MNREVVLDTLKLLQKLGVERCILLGGEPTVYNDLPWVISQTRKHDITPAIITNGRKLSNPSYLKKLHESGLRNLTVSIETLEKDIHDSMTGVKGSFEQTKKGITLALEQGFSVTNSTTISENNLGYMEQTTRKLTELGVKWLAFNIATPNVCEISSFDLSIVNTISEMHRILDQGKKIEANIHFAASVPICLAEKNGEIDKHFRGTCFVFRGKGLVIDNDGSVIPCVHWVGAPIDSIYNSDGKSKSVNEFLENWNEGFPSNFRDSLMKYPAQKCMNCEYWGVKCTGGCPLLRLDRDISRDIDLVKGGVS